MAKLMLRFCFFFSSRRRHTRCGRDWSSDVCSSDLQPLLAESGKLGSGFLIADADLALGQRGSVCGLHLARNLVVALFAGLPDQFALPHELVPVNVATLVDAHFVPPFFLPLPLGRPPSLPHSRIRRLNSALPHFLARTSALRLPMRLAALLASFGGS